MASPFESKVRNAIARGFKGKLLRGTLYRQASSGVDDLGDPIVVTIAEHTFEGIREDYSAFYRQAAGIPDTDCKVTIIAGLLAVVPIKDDKLLLRGQWFQIRAVKGDGANAAHECQCFDTTPVETPAVPAGEEWGSVQW